MKNKNENNLQFLNGGGEMGRLTRENDWSKTSLGIPETWPQSLRISLSLILNSKFPMSVWWGPQLLCFYNDAYRVTLGDNGKHPAILGTPGKEAWIETWDIIKPLIEKVLQGEAVWFEDLLVPINRNGKLEDVYWTFSYSPLTGEDNTVEGMLITCTETTEKVISAISLQQSEERFRLMADNIPNLAWMAKPDGWIYWYNKKWHEYTGTTPEQMEGWGWQTVHHPTELQRVTDGWKNAIANGLNFEMIFPLKGANGNYRQFLTRVVPVKNTKGEILHWFGTNTDVTEYKEIELALLQSNARFLNNIKQAPVAMCVFKGKNHVVEIVNDRMLEIWGKAIPEVINRPIFEGLPEAKGQGLETLMDHVFLTGERYEAFERPVDLPRNGAVETTYINFAYEPYRETDGTVAGIIAVATEVTQQVVKRKEVEASEKQYKELSRELEKEVTKRTAELLQHTVELEKRKELQNVFRQAPITSVVYRGPQFKVEVINNLALEMWGKKLDEVIDKPFFEIAPELKEVMQPILNAILESGKPYIGKEQPVHYIRNGQPYSGYFDFVYQPALNDAGNVTGIIAIGTEVSETIVSRKKIEESKRLYEAITQNTPDLIYVWDLSYRFTYANDALLKMWGRSWDDSIGKRLLEVGYEPWHAEMHEREMDQVIATKQSVRGEVSFPHATLGTRVYDYILVPVIDQNGNVQAIAGTTRDISQQAEAHKRILDSEERYHNLIYSSPTAIAILQGEDMVITIANNAIVEFWGKGKEIIGQPYFTALPELVQQGYKEVFDKVYKTGEPFYAVETPVTMTKNGVPVQRYYNFLLYAQRNINDVIDGIGIIATEVTNQALFNKQIQENEKRFRLLADSMPQHIWTADAAGNLNYYNQSVYDYSGLTPEQVDKEGWLQIVHPDERDENTKQWLQAVTTGNDFLFEHRFRRHDGQYRWMLSRATPQRDEQGNIQAWVGTSTDIQDQKTFTTELEKEVQKRTKELKELNEELIKSESRYHLMVEEVQDYAILYLNREGIVENWNLGAEKIKGYKAKEIIGKNFSTFYTDADRKINLPATLLKQATEKGKALQEGWRVKKDGTLFWASVVITAVHDHEGNVIGFSKVTHDLTEKKAAADNLKESALQFEQQNIELGKMNKELQSFAYISSHDLQEPLRKIQTFASRLMLEESDNLTTKGKQLFERMQNAAERMQTLIDDLLAYSRTNTAERKYVVTPLSDIVEEVKADLVEDIEKQHAVIEAAELCEVPVILFQFRQLLLNLISNSLKFAAPGRAPHITITSTIAHGAALNHAQLQPNANYCHIQYTDNGIGFDQQYSQKIFELFQRLHGRQEYAGTGIGLSIVKKIVDNHNGFITATGKVNVGATFDIYIPFN